MNGNSWHLGILVSPRDQGSHSSIFCVPLAQCSPLKMSQHPVSGLQVTIFFKWNRTENIQAITESEDSMIYTSFIRVI